MYREVVPEGSFRPQKAVPEVKENLAEAAFSGLLTNKPLSITPTPLLVTVPVKIPPSSLPSLTMSHLTISLTPKCTTNLG